MRKLLMMIVVLCGATIAIPALANTVYTYTGNPYTTCNGWSACNGTVPYLSIGFSTSMTTSQLANLPLTDITSTVTSFTFNDHAGEVLDQNTVPSGGFSLSIATGSNGLPTAWFADAVNPQGTISLYSCFNGICLFPFTNMDRTLINNLAPVGYSQTVGTWASPTTVAKTPEPGTTSLTLSGLAFLGLLMVFRKRQVLGLSAAD
jgi:hypothetical protein